LGDPEASVVDQVERVVVSNVRGKGRLTNKDDGIDADGMSEKLRLGGLKSVLHGAPEILTLKKLMRSYNNLIQGPRAEAAVARRLPRGMREDALPDLQPP